MIDAGGLRRSGNTDRFSSLVRAAWLLRFWSTGRRLVEGLGSRWLQCSVRLVLSRIRLLSSLEIWFVCGLALVDVVRGCEAVLHSKSGADRPLDFLSWPGLTGFLRLEVGEEALLYSRHTFRNLKEFGGWLPLRSTGS